MMNYQLLDLKVHGDERGKLVALESLGNVPFEIKRVYYIFDTSPEFVRGKHAHKNLEQIVIAIDGACQFYLDDGEQTAEIWLNRPDKGLYLGKNLWREMRHFSYGCKLMVLANSYYNEKEYIRDYQAFLRHLKRSSK